MNASQTDSDQYALSTHVAADHGAYHVSIDAGRYHIAFADIRPAAPVHILVVPHKPIPTTDDIEDADESLIGHMVIVARDIARQQGIAKSGYRLIINCNPDSGQEVYHLHLHLLGGKPLGPLVQRAC